MSNVRFRYFYVFAVTILKPRLLIKMIFFLFLFFIYVSDKQPQQQSVSWHDQKRFYFRNLITITNNKNKI
jgi:hypothetical protein